MGIAGFSVTYERSRIVAFTMSFHQEPTGISKFHKCMQKVHVNLTGILIPPPTEGEKLSVLIRPLSAEVCFYLYQLFKLIWLDFCRCGLALALQSSYWLLPFT